uniref:VHS domain-containing protein n=1 Tax=Oryza rufipogon TaxID=4529 RepID=A0A0E0NJM0_ORYRU
MGKGGELWDDSALVDAFDHAVATFKAMHSKNTQATTSENEEPGDPAVAAPAGEENISAEVADELIEKDGSQTEPCEASETPYQTHEERKSTEQAPLQEKDLDKEAHFSEPKIHASDVADAEQKDTSNQQTWDYNELVKKYYELEEQSRKVLEQLHQTNYWNYQVPGQSSVYQQPQVPAYSATAPDPHSSTIQSPCCCANVPLVSVSCCSTGQTSGVSSCMQPSGGCSISLTCDQCPGTSATDSTGATCVQQAEKVSTDSDQVAKAAMMTAEGAMNFMRSTISGDLGSFPRTDAASGKESMPMGMNPNFDTMGADSDLAVVLNAWYAAGFYTGSLPVKMSDNLMDKVSAFGERLKITGSEVSKKMTAGMSSMSFKMKEIFQGQTPADKIVEEATSENLDGPDWSANLEICDLINTEKVNSVELIRGIKKRIMLKDARVQYLSLVLLETIVKNCEKAFSEVAAERVLDEMVRLIDDPQTVVNNRNKALMLIEAWGESGDELRYLPVYEETYKSLKSRGVRFPGRDNESLAPIFTPARSVAEAEVDANFSQQTFEDVQVHTYTAEETKEAFDVARNSIELLSTVLSSSPQQDALQDDLTSTLVQQCYQSQHTIQRMIETAGDNEAMLFEALSVNDEIQKVLSKYEQMKKPAVSENAEQRPVVIPIATEHEDSATVGNEDALVRKPAGSRARSGGDDDILDDLDEMIFGKKGGSSSQEGPKKQDPKKDDLISF